MLTDPITDADLEVDLTDAWAELTDPESERGESATGLFDIAEVSDSYFTDSGHGLFSERDCVTRTASFRGLRVEAKAGGIYIAREWVAAAFGAKWIAEIEENAADKAQWMRAA